MGFFNTLLSALLPVVIPVFVIVLGRRLAELEKELVKIKKDSGLEVLTEPKSLLPVFAYLLALILFILGLEITTNDYLF